MAQPETRAASTGRSKGGRIPAAKKAASAKRAGPAKKPVVAAKHAVHEHVPASGPKTKRVLTPFDVLDFRKAYDASSGDRLVVIKHGVPAVKVYDLASKLNVSQDEMVKRLGLSKSTVSRKVHAGDTLSAEQSERVVGMAKLVGLVQTIVDESGDDGLAGDFDGVVWLEKWLSEPNPALAGALPSTYLDTREGQEILSTLIRQMQSGAYA
ncbi:antitoxin Xre-like helix-turn-helix domain-containing protein [Paraburkholderia acidipaludis]|uniref:antitoxin Xre-like helix-turn-helix domain-containing protein n=1 Tax=Paraburkholderia acidipaludis TaxID=660537 RepID=UPI00146FC042|nr:antitoxin Xre-like helix-turn-helix domain-containing protein [Paraburkholderia acidipaludis]